MSYDNPTEAEIQIEMENRGEELPRSAAKEPCPACGVPMIPEDGLWYCAECDAYHGEVDAEEQP